MSKTESVEIKFKLDKRAWDKHREAINLILRNCGKPDLAKVDNGDNVNFTYTFYIDYLGDINRTLEAVGQLCDDPKIVQSCECDILMEGKILLHEILKKLERMIRKLK